MFQENLLKIQDVNEFIKFAEKTLRFHKKTFSYFQKNVSTTNLEFLLENEFLFCVNALIHKTENLRNLQPEFSDEKLKLSILFETLRTRKFDYLRLLNAPSSMFD